MRSLFAGPHPSQIEPSRNEPQEVGDAAGWPVEWYEDCGIEVMSPGVPYWSVDLHRERSHTWLAEVLEAHSLLCYCEPCGARRDFVQISVPTKFGRAPTPPPVRSGPYAQASLCWHEVPDGEPYVSLSFQLEVMRAAWGEGPDGRPILVPTANVSSAEGLRYCDVCAERLDFTAVSIPLKSAAHGAGGLTQL